MDATYSLTLSGSGLSLGRSSKVSADTPNPFSIAIPVALLGELTTRTDADTGIITLDSGHGITTSDYVDLYNASTGALLRKDVDITAADSTTITINAGTGSDLPALNSDIIVCKQKLISPVLFDASGIQIFGIELKIPGATNQGRALFESSAPASVGDMTLTANSALISHVAAGASNPLSGDAVTIKASHGNTQFAATLNILSYEDRTP